MSVKLRKLIAHYEAEKAALIAQRAECLEEWDYGMARRFTKALAVVSQQLHTLYHLHDPQHEKKARLAKRIELLAASTALNTGYLHRYELERIAVAQQELDALQALTREQTAAPQATQLQEALMRLLQGPITAFTLVFDPVKRLYCNCRLVRRTLLLILPEVQRHRASHLLRKKQLRFLQGLGFRLYDQQDKLILITPFAVPEDVAHVKSILARLALDGLLYQELLEHAYISYREPDMR
ncbi:hypothetical protein MON38_07965 [Hymenobacter sp. DH14]|uniref:Uncharacterized protein n=1 Tax=Hymenobacter cyanobacteriorum TaxID=2926463 RepID=A0A9X1VFV9_9BACT|nr:hypothetical protein [Hymenobacter cyanobacteriorum]MCI1187352.1 hypothetical protein [Hymenobacter cyanobacteriorum]